MKKIFAFLSLTFAAQSAQANGRDTSLQQIRDTLANYSERIYALETQVKVYAEFLNNVEGIMAVVTGLLVIMSVLQYFQTRSERKSNDDALQKYQTTLEKIEDKNNALLETVRKNIAQTTNFIGSYSNLLKFQKDAEKIHKRLNDYIRQEQEERRVLELTHRELNAKAMRLVESTFNANFSSTYFSNNEISKYEEFKDWATQHIPFIEDFEKERNLNADIYFLIALHRFLTGQPKDAKKYFDRAIKKVERYIEKGDPDNKEILFPEKDLYSRHHGLKAWNIKLANKCYFYSGLNFYRQGEWGLAITSFENALKNSPYDVDSKFYEQQSKFWNETHGKLATLIDEVESLEKYIQNLPDESDKTKTMLSARLYLKLGDFCLPTNFDGKYKGEKDYKKALRYYKKAYDLIQEVNGTLMNIPREYSQIVPPVYFALAKTLKFLEEKNIDISTDNSLTWKYMYEQTENACRLFNIGIENPETRYILFYILAKTQQELGSKENAKESIEKAYTEYKRYCSHSSFKGYSPIYNAMLKTQDLNDEIINFQKSLVS